MAKADLMKFRELMFTDADFQEKLKKAGEAYTGDKSEKAVFDNVLIPLAKEYGLSATFEEFKEYIGAFTGGAGEGNPCELWLWSYGNKFRCGYFNRGRSLCDGGLPG